MITASKKNACSDRFFAPYFLSYMSILSEKSKLPGLIGYREFCIFQVGLIRSYYDDEYKKLKEMIQFQLIYVFF